MREQTNTTPFGRLLRRHRTRRNLTQEKLAYRADLSARHVSFLETGRSNPSRESVGALSRALDLSLRDRNALLRAAGFTGRYPERDVLGADDSHVRALFSFLLARHEPYPAFVVDRTWTVRMQNRGAVDLLSWLLEGEISVPVGDDEQALEDVNLLEALFDPCRLRPYTVNFDEVGRYLWDRLEEEIALQDGSGELERLRRRLRSYGRVPMRPAPSDEEVELSALPVHLRKGGIDVRLLSFLMTVAEPREVGLEEIRMETFLPADEESERNLRDVLRGT